MIKLIATDMDGTLLDEKGHFPKGFFSMLEKLKLKKVTFAIASGRPYVTLRQDFEEYLGQLEFICDNGAYIVDKNGEKEISVIPDEYVKRIIFACEQLDQVHVILCGTEGIYCKPYGKEYGQELDKYYRRIQFYDDLLEVQDDIFKIAILDLNGSEKHSYPVLAEQFGDDLKVVVSGGLWIDIMNPEVNKGAAVQKLQEKYEVSYDETMTFGDFYNDVEMLKQAKYSFVMENANEDMKQYGNYIAKSNREYGVVKAIEEYVL